MQLAEAQWATLVPHVSTLSNAIRGIDAHVRIGESGTILLRYVLRAAMRRVRIPPAKTVERADGLWKHTCFEAFIMVPGAAGYYELNFAPSRRWAVYRFDSYREGVSSADLHAPPEISVRRFGDKLEVDAVVCLHDLVALHGAPRLLLALSAVVEEKSRALSFWALKHGPGRPDFHNPDGFALELEI